MREVRCPSHTSRMAGIYGWGTLVVLVLAAGVWYANSRSVSVVLAFAGLFLLMLAKDVFMPGVESWVSGHRAELRVLGILRSLPDTYVAITNYVVRETARGDIDILLVGPPGVLVIEVKRYAGQIVYEYGKWWRRQSRTWKTRIPKNPSAQARGNRKALIGYLQQYVGPNSALSRLPSVNPVVVFVDAESLEVGTLTTTALRDGDLLPHIQSLPPKLGAADVEAIVSALGTTGAPRQSA